MLDHVPFTDPDTGIVSDYRVVNTSGHAENFTTAVGEAFFVSNERKIRMVIEYTEHADDEIRYKAVPYYAPGVQKPVGGISMELARPKNGRVVIRIRKPAARFVGWRLLQAARMMAGIPA